ncbi:hypothetical protein [Gordonia sp. VNK21]|uniref:hypothetical protein n=1 Tax=Gordonia sp. VNK21 TaxID=3382483 RepID=UPI0038D4ECC7
MNDDGTDFSLSRHFFFSLGAGVLVLAVATPIVFAVSTASPVAALIIAIAAIVLMVVVIALVSRRMLRGVQTRIDEIKAEKAAGD